MADFVALLLIEAAEKDDGGDVSGEGGNDKDDGDDGGDESHFYLNGVVNKASCVL